MAFGFRGVTFAKRRPIDLAERLAHFPREGLPLKAPVLVHWDEHQIPFLEAEHDEDLAVALGVLHVHLRWGQIEMMRRLALGRLSEMIGPAGIKIDHALRALGIARTAAAIMPLLPEQTARWLKCFIDGINHAIEHLPKMPPEFRILGIKREHWRVEDVLALGRLVSADVTWLSLIPLLREKNEALVLEIWRRLVGLNRDRAERAPSGRLLRRGLDQFAGLSWSGGSNSFAIAPSRSESGAAMLASDPHLAATIPGPFLIAGYKSPSFHLVGLMIPGLPFVALGRNQWISWGGTNLHAASSELFDISDLPLEEITERRERIRVRWWRDRSVAIRECAYGPVISDLKIIPRKKGRTLALSWMGSKPSDEFTAMLRLNQARNWDDFKAALTLFAVPGQNFTYADVDGHIGKLIAAKLPKRPLAPPHSPILPLSFAAHWQNSVTAADLPAIFDPAEGFIASANERPSGFPVSVGYLFSSNNRIERLKFLLGHKHRHSLADIGGIQRDISVPSSREIRDELLQSLRSAKMLENETARHLARELEAWDGNYSANSRGALCFELFFFLVALKTSGSKRLSLYAKGWNAWELMREDIASATLEQRERAVRKALPVLARRLKNFHVWGDMHRLRLRHFAGFFPIIGRRFHFLDWPAAGNSETVLKTAHAPTDRRHAVRLATTARHISDLADLDCNYFVLLGGQDGWLGSTTMLDQVPLWQKGDYIPVPLSLEAVRRRFSIHMELKP
ncbi:MAG: penicillin acylase family protein [Acidobacteriia bacterium]|nr:penicillin acylase family protein [Methyloceanibacter sp.]MCL6490826.1 penicillin acylase family protein [Terriglobia bacterium]